MLISTRATNILLVLILAVGGGIVAMLASAARGGPLDPLAAPAPTMHTLDNSPVVWDRTLAASDGPDVCHSSRFLCVLPTAGNPTGEAVLDRETSLVWQRVPPSGTENWTNAVQDCMNNQLGGRYGWRMPRVEEFRSVVDATGGLPLGNPFSNIQPSGAPNFNMYWTSSTSSDDATVVYPMMFPVIAYSLPMKTSLNHVWCVRSGAGLDGM